MLQDDVPVANGNGVGEPSLDLLLNHYPDTIFLERAGKIVWISANIADALRVEPGSLVGSPLEDLAHPDYAEAMAAARARVEAGSDATVVFWARRAHDHHVPLEVTFHPYVDDHAGCDTVGALRPLRETVDAREDVARLATAPLRLAERAGDILFTIDGAGMVLDAGATVYELLGWSAAEVVGITLPELVHPDDRRAATDYGAAVRSDTATGSIEIRARTRGGAWRWFLATGVLVSRTGIDDLDSMRVFVSWRDIDTLVREARFAEREAVRLRGILDAAIDPWLMLDATRDRRGEIGDFRVQEANQAACDYLRWPRERLLGVSLLDEFPGMTDHGLMAAYEEAIETGIPVVLHHFAYPHEVFGETRRYEIRAHAAGGRLMLTWRDTTPSSRASDELADAERLFRSISACAGDALACVTDDVIVWSSPGAEAIGLLRGSVFVDVLVGEVVPDDQSGVRTCSLLMDRAEGYRGRWHRPNAPAWTVRAVPLSGEGGGAVVTIIEEQWTVSTVGAP